MDWKFPTVFISMLLNLQNLGQKEVGLQSSNKSTKSFHVLSILILLIFNFEQISAQFDTNVSGVGTTSASFLEIGVGARAMGMGGAYTSVIDGPAALSYNPANIVWLNGTQVEFMHNQWFIDAYHDFVGVVIPLSGLRSSIGFHYVGLNYDDQPVRTVNRPEGTGELYSAGDYSLAMTLARALTDRFSFGLSLKYIEERIWNTRGGAAAIDMGIFYRSHLDGLQMGMSISNFGSEIKLIGRDLDTTVDPEEDNENVDHVPTTYKTDSYPLPILFRAGLSYKMKLGSIGSLLSTVDVLHPSNTTESINIGSEFGFQEMFYIRAGYNNLFEENTENGLTLG
ncbi:MAG TPA: PorV/PorQ family protein, partial [Candidatus Marinimicrobia bacterium]|nr:PorV/PorQ family protein [Candidatus Neomarinimicrobiota bacterium]